MIEAANLQPSDEFPRRIMDLLREVADRIGTPTRGPWEDGDGEPLQDDAEAAIAWIYAKTKKESIMSTEIAQVAPSLAAGGPLNKESWADFVSRLQHDCIGEGASRHITADALFIVQARRYTYGIDLDYGAELAIYSDDIAYQTPVDFYENGLDEDGRVSLDQKSMTEHDLAFLKLAEADQRRLLAEIDGVIVTGRAERWDFVSAHFTRDAADAFIRRKAHDYRDGLRVYVEAQTYSWEYNTIKDAIMDGRLILKDSA